MKAGDKCLDCKEGYLKQIDIPQSTASGIFEVVTLGLGGSDAQTIYECQNCFRRTFN